MSQHEIDPVEYGRLLASVDKLTKSVEILSGQVQDITNRLNTGKGAVLGMMMAAGGIGASVTEAIKHVFGK